MNLDKRLLQYVKEHPVALVLTIILGFIAGVFTIAQAFYISRIVNNVFLGGFSLEQVTSLLRVLLLMIVVRVATMWGSEVSANAIAERVKVSLRDQIFQHIQKLGPSYARERKTGELTAIALDGVEALEAYFSQYLPQLVLAAVIPLTFLVFIMPLDILSGIVLLLTAPLIPLFMGLIGSMAMSRTKRQWKSLNRMKAYFLDVLQGITTLKILGRSKDQIEIIAKVSDDFRSTTMSVLKITFLSALVLELVATLSTAIVAVEIGLRLLYGHLSFEQSFFILLLAPEFYLPLRLLGTRFHAGMAGITAAKSIFAILEIPVVKQPTDENNQNENMGNQNWVNFSVINYQNVFVTYQGNREALKGISFSIKRGESVALVGESGSGKTTIAELLLRFIQPTEGVITLDGCSLQNVPKEEFLKLISWVPQRPHLFNTTIAENIRLGNSEASDEEVILAAKQARAHEFIQSLPNGYNTVIGERGARLSGGQAQRIAIARAFLKDAPIIILDEPTANLDPENETLLQKAIQTIIQGRTALIIAHRLNTITNADLILVLNEGKIVERGNHVTLTKADGLYLKLLQSYTSVNIHSFSIDQPSHSAKRFNMEKIEVFQKAMPIEALSIEANGNKNSSIGIFGHLLGFVFPYSKWVLLSVLLGFITIASGIGLMGTSAYIISAAALHPSIAELQVAIVGVRFFGVTRGLFRYLERLTTHSVTFRLLSRLRVWFYTALEPLVPARFMHFHSGDLLTRITSDIQSLENFYVRVIAPPLVALLIAIITSIYLGKFNPRLGQALLILMFLGGIIVPLFIRLISQRPNRETLALITNLHISLIDGIQGLPDSIVFNQIPVQAAEIHNISKQLALTRKRIAQISGLQTALVNLLANLNLWIVLIFTIPLVSSGEIAGVYLAVVILVALTSFEAIIPLPVAAQYLEENIQAAKNLYEIVDTEPEVQDITNALDVPERFEVDFSNLSFHYPVSVWNSKNRTSTIEQNQISLVLRDINFRLMEGEHIAIVGPSGAGKTTLAYLLLRFWEYQNGSILLNKQELRTYDQDSVRSRISVVSQNTYLFNGTIYDNIRIAKPKATNEAIEKVAKRLQIHKHIQSLPDGYNTWIGEQGFLLSGGERQFVAIARALLRDTNFLILDEATANLDAISSKNVLEAIYSLMEGRTTLMITHNLMQVGNFKHIIVMDQGRIVERGSYQELMNAEGMFKKMWDLQNQFLFSEAI